MLLNIKNEINELRRVCDEVFKFCTDHKIPEKKRHDIILILDEIITNIINYAYPDGGEHVFTLDIQEDKGHISMKLTDSGIAFDPLAKENPDTESSLEDRKIGGLGIFIVKQLSEIIEYTRVDESNQLTITVSIHNNKAD